ncbi:MAG: sulfatase-like hydrolase/transferase [Planctomycetota bacterium]
MNPCLGPLLATLVLSAGSASPAAPPPASDPPNFLVLVWDDVGWEDIFEAQTPLLDIGAQFSRKYVQARACPTCTPSRVGFHFGRLPSRDKVSGVDLGSASDPGVPPSIESLADSMKAGGYSTGMFGKWHVSNEVELAPAPIVEAARIHGYDVWRAGRVANVTAQFPPGPWSHYNWPRIDDGVETLSTQYASEAVMQSWSAWWDATPGPKYAHVSVYAPHTPYDPPPSYLLPPGYPTPQTQRDFYLADIAGLDRMLAEVAIHVDLSNTYVFLVSDNGTPGGVSSPNTVWNGHKGTPWEGGVRIPFYVWGPGVLPGFDSDLVQVSDIPATVCELAGLPVSPDAIDSISFSGTLSGGVGSRTYSMCHYFTSLSSGHGVADRWCVVRDDGMKLVHDSGLVSLYDLSIDYSEKFPLNFGYATNAMAALDLFAYAQSVLGPNWPN